MNASATIDSFMQTTINKELVKWAAGHVMFCPGCDKILDCRSTVVATHNTGGQAVLCADCWDKKTELYAFSEIVDGRKLWVQQSAPRVHKAKSRYTFCERIERGLVASGWTRDWTDRSKYAAWIKQGESSKLFTGPSGALRKGRCASDSISIGDPANQRSLYADLLSIGEQALELDRLTKKS